METKVGDVFDWEAFAEVKAEFKDINMKFGDYLQEALNGDQTAKQNEKLMRIKQGRVILLKNPDRQVNASYEEAEDSSDQFFDHDSDHSKPTPQYQYMYLPENYFDVNDMSEIEMTDNKSVFLYKDSPMPSFDKKSKSSKINKVKHGNSIDFFAQKCQDLNLENDIEEDIQTVHVPKFVLQKHQFDELNLPPWQIFEEYGESNIESDSFQTDEMSSVHVEVKIIKWKHPLYACICLLLTCVVISIMLIHLLERSEQYITQT